MGDLRADHKLERKILRVAELELEAGAQDERHLIGGYAHGGHVAAERAVRERRRGADSPGRIAAQHSAGRDGSRALDPDPRQIALVSLRETGNYAAPRRD